MTFFVRCLFAREAYSLYRFAGLRSWRFRSTKLSATTKLDTKHKTSFNHFSPHCGKRLLAAGFIFCFHQGLFLGLLLSIFCCVVNILCLINCQSLVVCDSSLYVQELRLHLLKFPIKISYFL